MAEQEREFRRERVFRDLSQALDVLGDDQRISRYRFPQRIIFDIIAEVDGNVWPMTGRFHSIPTQLQLLAEEIRHERNVILQCVHYIVKNKFFGIGQSESLMKMDPEKAMVDSKSSEIKSVVIDDTVCM